MAGIDHSIYFQQKTPDIIGGIQRGLQMRQVMDERNKNQAIKDAYSQSMVKGEDGKMTFSHQKAIDALAGKGFGQEAHALQQQALKSKRENQKFSRENQMQQMQMTAQVLGSANDPQSWETGKQKLQSMGVDLGQYANAPYDPGLKNVLMNRIIPPLERMKMEAAAKEKALDRELQREKIAAQKAKGETTFGKLTPGQKKTDETFAKDFNEWTSGGADVAESEINKLQGVVDKLDNEDVTTGGMTGMFPDRITSDEVLSARANVESTVMNSLRAILGAQFTEKEGNRIIKNTWNEADSTKNNKDRLQRLVSDLRSKAKAKSLKSEYFQRYGTLKNYEAQTNVASFNKSHKNRDVIQGGNRAYADEPQKIYKSSEIEWAD